MVVFPSQWMLVQNPKRKMPTAERDFKAEDFVFCMNGEGFFVKAKVCIIQGLQDYLVD